MKFSKNQFIAWAGAATLVILAWFLRSVLAYFLVATILAFIGAPLMRFLDQNLIIRGKKLPSGFAAFLVLLTFVSVISLFLFVVVPPLAEQLSAASSVSESQLMASFGAPLNDLKSTVESWGISADYLTLDYLKAEIKTMLNMGNLSQLASDIFSAASSTVGWIFIVTFITFFLLKEKFLLYRVLHGITPSKYEAKMQAVVRNLNTMLGRYFRSLLLQIFVFGLYIFIGLSICGEKYALTIAVFSGLVNLISYIGPLLGLSFAMLFSMLSHIGASFYGVILPELVDVVIVYTIAIALDNFVSYPMIFSNSLKVHPLELFFVILSGAQLAGLPGMMVAAPAYTVLRILAKETLSRFEVIQNITRKI